MKKIFFPVLLLVSLLLSLGLGQLRATGNDTGLAIQRGVEFYRSNDFPRAIAVWEKALQQDSPDRAERTVLLKNLAKAHQQIGDYPRSIDYWERAIADYRHSGEIGQVGRSLTEQAGDYLQLGQARRAIDLLCGSDPCQPDSALAIARQQRDGTAEIAATATLAEAYRVIGETERAIDLLVPLAAIEDSPYRAEILNGLGSAYLARAEYWQIKAESARKSGKPKAAEFEERARENFQNAGSRFRESLKIREQIAPLLQLIKLATRVPLPDSGGDLQRALQLWESLSDTPAKVYTAVDLAGLPNSSLSTCPASFSIEKTKREELLEKAIRIADRSRDRRSLSFAEGALGHLYECGEQPEKALSWTRKALMSAEQNAGDRDSLYLWEWQSGRILQERGETTRAIEAYQSAFDTLEKLRGEQVSSGREIRLNFRDLVEPLYRQLARARLDTLESKPSAERQREIDLSLKTIDALRLAELQNYLGNDCLLRLQEEKKVDELVDKNTAVFSSIIFEDETVIILTLPDGTREVHAIALDRPSIVETVTRFRQSLIEGRLAIDDYDTRYARILYDRIVRPFETDLATAGIDTLVFLQDSFFRAIPMAALHDGERFLIEKYATATTIGLRLTPPTSEKRQNRSVLVLGVTGKTELDGQNFEALPNVSREIERVGQLFPDSRALVDEDFTVPKLQQELDRADYRIVHIATHAQFGTISEDTFLVTGDGGKLTLGDLEFTFRARDGGRETIELLALTACQTAEGDDRSSLGLAGVAVGAGVRSALASLWAIPDESTLKLVGEFYRQLAIEGTGKAKALQKAQLQLLNAKKLDEINDQYDNPAYWSAFILLGNWN